MKNSQICIEFFRHSSSSSSNRSFTNSATTNHFNKHECCYLQYQYMRINKETQFFDKFVDSQLQKFVKPSDEFDI